MSKESLSATKNESATITESQWNSFSEDVAFLWCPASISVLEHPPDPLTFCRDFCQRSRPCIIRNAILNPTNGEPLRLTLDDIMEQLGKETRLTVDVTPDGQGDSVRTTLGGEEIFVQPKECNMTLQEFSERLRRQSTTKENPSSSSLDANGRPMVRLHHDDASSSSTVSARNDPGNETSAALPVDSVVYYSRQNDCLRAEVQGLQELFPSGIAWAEEAFHTRLEAVNLWMGNESAISSMHKDHYENLFYVASGEKVFTLCPPSDVAFLYEHKEYLRGVFGVDDENQWGVAKEEEELLAENTNEQSSSSTRSVRWIAPDVSQLLLLHGSSSLEEHQQTKNQLLQRYPLLKYTHPTEVRVQAGELLYLPSLWFHRVTQSCETIGVNYWYDMKFDSPLWCYFSFLQQLKHREEAEAD